MEYTYESLRECHGLRFRATLSDKREEGIIKVGEDGITLCYGAKDPGRMFIFERSKTLSFTEQSFGILPNDFEIVPRDPETFQDWQVGDKISRNGDVYTVIFRCGEVVIFKYRATGGNWCCSAPFTCEERFCVGFRLVLTDIEKQIIEEREWKPQAGDICFAETGTQRQRFIIIYDNNSYSLAYFYGSRWKLRKGVSWSYSRIRPATYEEKQRLFDAMAKEGKRWNAEKKVVEDIKPEDNEAADVKKMISDALKGYIPKGDIEGFPGAGMPFSFKRFDPVLVRDKDDDIWSPRMFLKNEDNKFYVLSLAGTCVYYNQCIPLNKDTEKLIGRTEQYYEQ